MMKRLFYFILFFITPIVSYCNVDLQKLVDGAVTKGELRLEKKTYVLRRPLKLPSGFKLFGNGATLEPSATWKKDNDQYFPLIEIVDVSNVYLSGLIVDNKAKRGIQGMPSYSILVLNSSSIVIENNIFRDLGLRKESKVRHGSPFILAAAQEVPGDFSYIPKKYRNKRGSVNGLRILKNTFTNNEFVNSFAIRLVTLWTKDRQKSTLNNKISNAVIADNKFYGEYDWNTLEMAGPATVGITVERNYISGKSINNIDVDKGASDIIIKGNILTNLGLPSRHKENKNVRVSPIMVHGNTLGYECENVQILDNKIEKITNPNIENSRFLYSSGIGVLHARNVRIKGNRITKAFVGKNYGGAICLDQSVYDVFINENYIDEVYRGIIVTPNTKNINNITIENNNVSSRAEPMMVLTAKQGKFSKLTVKNNITKSNNNKRIILSRSIIGLQSDVK
ncbi:hypothetical protein HX021_16715 [Sphingobacterium sp. N143]|uniref:hypothetical protein n=1 Tax=Sphingobacterium sp. N143 TaxID=2746727 RepID=UPI0025771613|nr:hypothetical protein [Sphingobacterium sp. N143]MDM1295935.1 hypothetical protein [Sphingobacterium sp. N143]